MKKIVYVAIMFYMYEGCVFNKDTKVFFDKVKALKYADRINKKYGYKDRIDKFIVKEVEEG